MPAAKGSDFSYLHDPDPAVAKRRSRNASRAATLGNSKVGAEIRSTRLMVRELLEVTLSGNLDPVVRKRLAEITQLIQSYCRLAELEVTSGEAPRFPGKGYAVLPEDTAERTKARRRRLEMGRSWRRSSVRPCRRTVTTRGHSRRWVDERGGECAHDSK